MAPEVFCLVLSFCNLGWQSCSENVGHHLCVYAEANLLQTRLLSVGWFYDWQWQTLNVDSRSGVKSKWDRTPWKQRGLYQTYDRCCLLFPLCHVEVAQWGLFSKNKTSVSCCIFRLWKLTIFIIDFIYFFSICY